MAFRRPDDKSPLSFTKGGLTKGVWGAEQSNPQVPTDVGGLNFHLGRGCKLSGKLSLAGGAQIDGAIEGEITSSGELNIGEAAEIEARISGEKVRVFGKVNGDIECSERLELNAGARVFGNITSPSVVMHDGVLFEGHCKMGERPGPTGHDESEFADD